MSCDSLGFNPGAPDVCPCENYCLCPGASCRCADAGRCVHTPEQAAEQWALWREEF